ncbi:MAG: site-2 protease family protein, partial [bacterium]
IAAKKAGVKVEEFAIGFPPRLIAFKKGETEYSINLIPIGGYVKMLGELEQTKDKRALENQKPSKRFVIAIAGVVMNLLLAWFILTIGFAVGMSPIVSEPDSLPGKKISSDLTIESVVADSAASKVGLRAGDIILEARAGGVVFSFDVPGKLSEFTTQNAGKEVTFKYKRDDVISEKIIQLSNTADGPLGVTTGSRTIVRVPWYQSPYIALVETYKITKLTFDFLGGFFGKLFSTGKVAEGVGGPVAIYIYTGLAVKLGIMTLMQFIAMLSINLALINILPFPALDGGRILFILVEGIFRKKVVKERLENIIHTAGFALLLVLMVAITYKDVINLPFFQHLFFNK